MMNRLFIALNVPDIVLDEIYSIRNEIYPAGESVKWESKEKLHITLKFLGDVKEYKIEEIVQSLNEISKSTDSFECEFDKFGMFYKRNTPRILWLGTPYNNNIQDLHIKIDTSMSRLGFDKEIRKFKAHLTLLRIKGNEDLKKLEKFRQLELKPIKFRAQNIELIKSELKPAGSVYTIIKSFKLN